MAASTLVVKDTFTDVDTSGGTTFALVSTTANGALYRLSSRALQLPLSIEFAYKLGTPGQKGNDSLKVVIADTLQNATTKEVMQLRANLELSVPRDAATVTDAYITQIMGFMASIIGKSAHRTAIADASVV